MYTNFSTMQDCLLKWLVFTFGHNWRESFDKWKAIGESGECDQLTTRQPLIRWGFCAQIKVRCGLIRLGSDCQWHGLHAHNRNISVSRPVCLSQWYDSPLLCDPFKPRLNRNCKVSIYISIYCWNEFKFRTSWAPVLSNLNSSLECQQGDGLKCRALLQL